MPDILNGVIPFGSGDSSVVFECSQKSQAEIDSANGTLQTSGGAVVTPQGVINGSGGGVQYDLSGLSALLKAQLQYTGQISFTIDALHIATPAALYGESEGYTSSAYFIHFNQTDNVNLPYGRIWVQGVVDVLVSQVSADSDVKELTQAIHEVIGQANGGNITITMSWNGNETELIANGFQIYKTERTVYTSGVFEFLMTGALLTGSSPALGGVQSDIVLATRSVQYAAHPMLSRALWYGDSYVDQSGSSSNYNAGCVKTFDAFFRRIGIGSASVEAGVSGATVWDGSAGGNLVLNQINGTGTKPDLGIDDLEPGIIMFRDFVNDVISDTIDLNNSIASRKGHIQTALDKNPNNHVIIGNVPSQALNPDENTDYVKNRVDEVNLLIDQLPADMEAIDSAYADRVHIVDQFTLFGGHNPIVKLYQENNNHPNGFGQYAQGNLYAEKAAEIAGLI